MNKKLFAGIAGVSLVGVSVVGALIGGYFSRKNAIDQRLKAIEEAKKSDLNLLEAEKISKNSGVSFYAPMSLTSPQQAKVTFDIPAKYTGKSLTLFYKPLSVNASPSTVTLLIPETTTESQKMSFLFNVLPQTKYEYQLALSEKPNETLFYSQLRTPKMPVLKAKGAFRAANINISDLSSYHSKTLVIKAVTEGSYTANGIEAFENSLLSQNVLIRSEDRKKVWFKPVGNGVFKDGAKYKLMLFEEQGLVPLLAQPVDFVTALNKVRIDTVESGSKVANFNIKDLRPYQGRELTIAYKPVNSETSFFKPINNLVKVQKLLVPVFEEEKEAALNIKLDNLKPGQIYKLQVFDGSDSKLSDGFLIDAITIKTKTQPTIQAKVDELPNPNPEVSAAYIKVTNLIDYIDNLTGSTSGLNIKYQKKANGVKPWAEINSDNEVPVKIVANESYAAASILNLEPATEYVFQLFGGINSEPLLETNNSFTTKAGFTSLGVSADVSLGKDGQTNASIKFSGQELEQFYSSTGGDNSLEIRYKIAPTPKDVTSTAIATDWEAADVQKANTTIALNGSRYTAAEVKLNNLQKGTEYIYAIFSGEKKIQSVLVSGEASFYTREEVSPTTVALQKKVVLHTNVLTSYIGSKYKITYKEKNPSTVDGVTVQPILQTLVEENVPENGKIEATFGSDQTKPLKASTAYEYTIYIVSSDNQENEVAKAEFTTKDTEFTTPTIDNGKIYPTSFEVKIDKLNGLKNQNLQLVYRKKGETTFIVSTKEFNTSEATVTQILDMLTALTEYEVNLVLKAAPTQLLSETWVSATTKDVLVAEHSDIKQTSLKISYSNLETYKGDILTLKYWKTKETDVTKLTVPSDTAQLITKTLNVTAEGSLEPSLLEELDPQSQYAYQVFKDNSAVSYVKTVTTAKQVKVEKIDTYLTSANVILTNLSTIVGEGSDKLKLLVIETTESTTSDDFSSSVIKTINFSNEANKDTQNFLVDSLEKNKNYILQVYLQSDISNSKPLITTARNNPDDHRVFKTLDTATAPQVSAKLISNSSAKLEITNLGKFIGQKLVLKYTSSYWTNKKEYAFVVPELSEGVTVSDHKESIIITELLPEDQSISDVQDWFYEIYVDINGDSSKVQLLEPTSVQDVKTKFTTKPFAKATTNTVLSTLAKLKFKNLFSYKTDPNTQPLIVKAFPKKSGATIDWTVKEGVIKSEVIKSYDSITDDNAELEFSLKALSPNTEYVYQLFVDGLNEPILVEAQTFTTKGQIKLVPDYVANTSAKLLLSNVASFIGETLQVSYKKGSDTAKTWEISVSDAQFTDNLLIPLLLSNLETGQKYSFEVKMKTSDTTWSENLLNNDLSITTPATLELGLALNANNQVKLIFGKTNNAVSSLNYLKGRKLVFSWNDSSATEQSANNKIEFSIPVDYTENTFSPTNTIPTTLFESTKTYNLKLVDKDSEFSEEINFMNSSETIVTDNIKLSELTKKSGKKDKADILVSEVNTIEKWKENFNDFTLTNYTVNIEEINVNAVEGKAILTLSFVKTSEASLDPKPKITTQIVFEGFKTTAAPMSITASGTEAKAKP